MPGENTISTLKPVARTRDDAAVQEEPCATAPDPVGVETILVIEDEPTIRVLIDRILRRLGYRVLLAAGAREAATTSASYTGVIDLVLSDVMVPDADGSGGTLTRAEAQATPPKTLFMSGYPQEALLRNGTLKRNGHFIEKPFAASALAWKVREVLDA